MVELPSIPDTLSLPFILPSSNSPLPSLTTLPQPADSPLPSRTAPSRPLKVYSHRPSLNVEHLVDSSPMVTPYLTLVLSPSRDLSIAIQKGTRSTLISFIIF